MEAKEVLKIGKEVKKATKKLYGNRFESLILFGSFARGDFHDESDLDLAVVLKDPTISPSSEILKITSYTSEIEIEHSITISVFPVAKQKLQLSQLSVYQSIRNEGITI